MVDPTMQHQSLGAYLADLRRSRNVSQQRIGHALGLQRSAVCKLELGRRSISARRLALWMDLLDATEAERLRAFDLARQADTADLRAAS